jgi:hypothetical protein
MSYQHPTRVDAVKEIDKILERRAKAESEVLRLCAGRGRWQMSVPVQANDSDILLIESLEDISHMARELVRLNNLMGAMCSVVTSSWGDSEDGFEDDEPQAKLFAILEKWRPEGK